MAKSVLTRKRKPKMLVALQDMLRTKLSAKLDEAALDFSFQLFKVPILNGLTGMSYELKDG